MAPPPLTPPSKDGRKFCVTPTKTGYFGTDPPELAPKLELPFTQRSSRSPSSPRFYTPRSHLDDSPTTDSRSDASYNEKPSTSRMAGLQNTSYDTQLPARRIKLEPPPQQEEEPQLTLHKQQPYSSINLMKRESSADETDYEVCTSSSTMHSVSLPQIADTESSENTCRALLPTEHFCARLRQIRCQTTDRNRDLPELNTHVNEMFMQRLREIDLEDAANLEGKLCTYQDWVESLIQINSTLIMNMDTVEKKVKEVVHYTGNTELAKAQSDICKLLKFIQHAYHRDHWDLDGLNFETITTGQILGQGFLTTDPPIRLQSGTDATVMDYKALSLEVASKHDECCKMKKAILSLEEEIQNAHKKIQLKDDVIRGLHSDLRRYASQQADDGTVAGGDQNLQPCDSSASKGFESARERLEASYTSLRYNEKIEEHKRRQLELELEELLALHKGKETVSTSGGQQIIDIVRRLFNEKELALRRHDLLRQKLVHLEPGSPADEAIPICSDLEQSIEMQNDAEILEALRKRFQGIKDKNSEILNTMKKLDMETKIQAAALEEERNFNRRNKQLLREIADMISEMSGEEFVYQDVYATDTAENPFLKGMRRISDKHQLVQLQTISDISQQANVSEHYKKKVQRLENVLKEKKEIIQRLNESMGSNTRRLCCANQCVDVGVTTSPSGPCQLPPAVYDHKFTEMRTELDVLLAENRELRTQYDDTKRQESFLQNHCKKLNTELVLTKRAEMQLREKLVSTQTMLRDQNESRLEHLRKYQDINKKYEEQSKRLQASNARMKKLEEWLQSLERQRSSYDLKMNEMAGELHMIKENYATLLGKKTSLEDQLQHSEQNIEHLNNKLKEERIAHQGQKTLAETENANLQTAMRALSRKHGQLQKAHKELQEDLRAMSQSFEQAERLIVSFRKWSDEQIKCDKVSKETYESYEQRIQLLLKENQEFHEKNCRLQRKCSSLQHEVDHLKMCEITRSPNVLGNNIERISRQIDNIRRNSQHIHDYTDAIAQDNGQLRNANRNTNRNTNSSRNTDT